MSEENFQPVVTDRVRAVCEQLNKLEPPEAAAVSYYVQHLLAYAGAGSFLQAFWNKKKQDESAETKDAVDAKLAALREKQPLRLVGADPDPSENEDTPKGGGL